MLLPNSAHHVTGLKPECSPWALDVFNDKKKGGPPLHRLWVMSHFNRATSLKDHRGSYKETRLQLKPSLTTNQRDVLIWSHYTHAKSETVTDNESGQCDMTDKARGSAQLCNVSGGQEFLPGLFIHTAIVSRQYRRRCEHALLEGFARLTESLVLSRDRSAVSTIQGALSAGVWRVFRNHGNLTESTATALTNTRHLRYQVRWEVVGGGGDMSHQARHQGMQRVRQMGVHTILFVATQIHSASPALTFCVNALCWQASSLTASQIQQSQGVRVNRPQRQGPAPPHRDQICTQEPSRWDFSHSRSCGPARKPKSPDPTANRDYCYTLLNINSRF
ncbi:hypothetical protein JZ751_012868 [Albula glossodonta]|uniref:Uncharacterized protein n=1 Tax=Albula glossodonta TaxID=121402 RepID=A0A8T2N464_9TELE|nr:hypothetical protein JZ751_012868 [Albula glossodonta]